MGRGLGGLAAAEAVQLGDQVCEVHCSVGRFVSEEVRGAGED